MDNPLVAIRCPPTHEDKQCCICDGQSTKALYAYHYGGKTSEILQCLECGHLFMCPVPLTQLNARTMDATHDAELFGSNFLKASHKHLVIKREINYVKRILRSEEFSCSKTPRLLDIGCGTGWTTSIWQENGFSVVGIEPSIARGQMARDTYHIPVSNEHIENFVTEELFDVVVMRHLLEHIENPITMIQKVRSFLKPNGLLVIVIPNINCIGRYIFKENWEWILPWHLHFYSPETLERLLVKCGFSRLKIYQMPSPLWYPLALNKARKRKLPYFLSFILICPIVFLGALLNLNDNMTLIFRKK